MTSIAAMLEEKQKRAEQGNWYPACGGTETPFVTRAGIRVLYCYQPSTGKHAYLNCETDIFLSNEEADRYLNK